MEQILISLAGLRNSPGDVSETWVDGEIPRSFSLEIVSFGGEIHFYVRCYWKVAPLVKAAFFSYYPDIELVPQDVDYVTRFPEDIREMNAQDYEIYGVELLLARESAYPTRTYKDFESPDEERTYDPVGHLIEFLGQVQREQIVALQFVIVPAEPDWAKKWGPLLEKLKESSSAQQAKKSAARTWDFSQGPLPVLGVELKEKKDDPFKAFSRTPGETEVLKAVEGNMGQPAFKTTARFLYFSPKPLYYDSFAKRGVLGSLNQYAGLNSFKANPYTLTLTKSIVRPYVFPKVRALLKKERVLYNYKKRVTAPSTFIDKLFTSHPLNWNFYSTSFEITPQCLASIFHPPTKFVVTAPHMKRIDSRKAGPPPGLAIFGNESNIDRFQ